jgi:outer membrane protein assembly factor BamB
MYDSVIIMWQASDPNTGQSIPSGGWGWGGWMQYNGMTYATVFNLGWYWPGDPCKGEVFLHEWLHGVTGFYMFLGYPFPVEDLHGAEEAGYTTNASGCWEPWLRDYMRGRVLENGVYKGISPQAWQRGSITNYNIQGWRGEYYNNDTLSDLPVMVRDDPNIDFDWQGSPPHPLVNGDHFSVRWTRRMTFENFSYRFKIFHDDGARLYLDGTKIFENWCANCSLEETVDWPVTAGQHLVTYEMYESAGWAGAKLNWSIIDNGQPAGHIDLPATGADIEPGPVDFTAEAWDNAGGSGVKEVEFFVYYSGAWHLAGTDTSAPYSVVWTAPDGLPEQALQFSIHVTDRAGNELVDAGGVRQAHYAACLTCGPAESGWPLLRGNLLKNGRSPYSGPRMPLLAWSVSGSLRGTPPALDETGRVFLGMGNQVLAMDPDGRTAWTYTAAAADPENKRFTASPAVTHSGALYIPNNDGSLYAFSTAAGSLKWTFPTGGWTTSAPTVGPDGVIYFGSSDTYLRALTPGGKLKWKFQAGSWVQSSPALGPDGSVYFGASDQCVYRLNPDGTQKWKTCFPWEEYNFFDGPPALGADGTVYIASVRGNLFAFNGSDGGLKWKYSTGLDANAESGSASPAVGSDGTIYITSGNQNYGLFAIRPNGTLKWKYALPASPYCSPSIDAGGVIYTVADDGGLYAVGPDGKLKWKLTLETGGRGLNNNPVIGPGGRIYVGAYWGAKLYAVSEGGEHPLYLPGIWR